MSIDLTKVAFYSGINYLKRDPAISGSVLLTLGALGSNVTQTITHNLGYVPFYQVLVDQAGDGIIWSATKVNSLTETSTSGRTPAEPALTSWITTTGLTIRLDNNTTPTATGTRTVYYIIYRDYGNV